MKLPLPAPPALALSAAFVALLFLYPSAGLFFLLNGLLLLLILVDYNLAPGAFNLVAERRLNPVLTLGEESRVAIKLRLQEPTWKRFRGIKLKDEPPPGLEAISSAALSHTGPRHCLAEYTLIPARRGDFCFGRVNLRCRGPLGLAVRQVSLEAEQSKVKVYPALGLSRRGLSDYLWTLRQAGQRPSRLISAGTEFEYLREYTPDDDYRQINWKASARQGKLVSNHYQVEKSQNLLLVFEAGRSMLAESGGRSKLDLALEAGLRLGSAALLGGDLVGAMAFAEEVVTYLPPDSRGGQIRKIAASLYTLHPRRVEPAYRKALIYLAQRQKKRAMICIFSDLIDRRASLELVDAVLALAKRHLILLVTLADHSLDQILEADAVNVETAYRKAVAEQYLTEREQGMAFLRNRGVEVLEMAPKGDPAVLINRYLELKSRLKI